MKPIIGISMGDPAGIGAEITAKALLAHNWQNICTPVVIGDFAAMQDALGFCGLKGKLVPIFSPDKAVNAPGVINLIDMGFLSPGTWQYKQVQKHCGEASFRYVESAVRYAMECSIHAVVTGPINKEAINLAGHHFSGHTEILANLTGTPKYAMLLLSETLRVIHATTHVSMRDACDLVSEERIFDVIELARQAMELLGIPRPCIAVAGLNAHCSENGLFGHEEEQSIIPAIQRANAMGIHVEGPVPPDTVFVKAQAGLYDIVVAMYHDQGHIPLKLSGFKLDEATNRYTSMSGVNCTVGLPIIRTSVDHGTAFGKAGEGRANEESLVDAMKVAVRMANTNTNLRLKYCRFV